MRSIISILFITSVIFGCKSRNRRDFSPTSGSINNPLLADESPGDAVQKPSPKSQVYVIGDAKQKYQQALNLVENLKEQLHKSEDKDAPKKRGLIDFVVVDNKEKALSLLNLEAEKRLKQEQESFEGGSLIAEAMIVDPKKVSKLALTSPNQDEIITIGTTSGLLVAGALGVWYKKKSVGQGRSRNTFNPPARDIKKPPMVLDDANQFQNAETKVVDSSDRNEVIDNRVTTSDRVSSGERISTEIQPGLTLTQIVRLQVGVKRFKEKRLKRREIGQRVEVMIDSLNKDISALKEASRPIKLHLSDQYSKSVIDAVSNTRRVAGASFSKTLLRLHQTSGLGAALIDPTETAGGFGKTYIIKQNVGGERKTFAVKEMHSARNKGRGQPYSDAELQRRFVQELASPLAIGKHKNIIDTYGGFEKDGRWYLVMEAAEGDMFGRFENPATSRAYFQQLVAGVDYMHNNRNIAHLDIKPENAVLMPDGKTVKLIDFGSASGSQVSATRYKDVEGVASIGQGFDYANRPEVLVLRWLRNKGLLNFRNIGVPNPGRLGIETRNQQYVEQIRSWLSDAHSEGVIKFNPEGRKDEIVIREFIELYDPKSRDIFALGELLRVDIGNRSPFTEIEHMGNDVRNAQILLPANQVRPCCRDMKNRNPLLRPTIDEVRSVVGDYNPN